MPWVLLRPLLTITSKMQETGPTVYSPYPRRPGHLTICRNWLKSLRDTSWLSKTEIFQLVKGIEMHIVTYNTTDLNFTFNYTCPFIVQFLA